MNYPFIHKLLGLTLLIGVILALAVPSQAAEHTRSRSGSYTTGSGKSGAFKKTTTRGNGSRATETSRTNQDGATASRSTNRTVDKESGSGIRTVEVTKADGSTETRTQTFTLTKEPVPAP